MLVDTSDRLLFGRSSPTTSRPLGGLLPFVGHRGDRLRYAGIASLTTMTADRARSALTAAVV